MAGTDRTIPEPDTANLERLRQVTARIRARAAEWQRRAGDPLPARPAPRPRDAIAPHWSDGPLADADSPDDGRDGEG